MHKCVKQIATRISFAISVALILFSNEHSSELVGFYNKTLYQTDIAIVNRVTAVDITALPALCVLFVTPLFRNDIQGRNYDCDLGNEINSFPLAFTNV